MYVFILLVHGLPLDRSMKAFVFGTLGLVRICPDVVGECTRVIPAHSDPVTSLCFSPTSIQILASCSYDGLVRIWDCSTGDCLRTFIDDRNPAW